MGHPSARRVRVSGAIITEVTCRHTKPRERRPRRPRRSTPVSRRARDRGTGFLNRIRWTESATRSAFRATRGHARAIHRLVARRATATAFFSTPRNPRRVASTSRGKMFDQDIANFLLVKKLKPGEVRWGLLPSSLVSANLSDVSPELGAFHAVGVSGRGKFDVLEAAWRRHPRRELRGSSAAADAAAGFGCAADTATARVPPAWRAQGSYAPPPVLLCGS